MKRLLNKIFFRSNNLDYISQNIKDLTKKTPTHKILKQLILFHQKVKLDMLEVAFEK